MKKVFSSFLIFFIFLIYIGVIPTFATRDQISKSAPSSPRSKFENESSDSKLSPVQEIFSNTPPLYVPENIRRCISPYSKHYIKNLNKSTSFTFHTIYSNSKNEGSKPKPSSPRSVISDSEYK